jgi:hypothetical protein
VIQSKGQEFNKAKTKSAHTFIRYVFYFILKHLNISAMAPHLICCTGPLQLNIKFDVFATLNGVNPRFPEILIFFVTEKKWELRLIALLITFLFANITNTYVALNSVWPYVASVLHLI